MTAEEGKKCICVPSRNGGYTYADGHVPEVGEQVMAYPLAEGSYFVMPVPSAQIGNTLTISAENIAYGGNDITFPHTVTDSYMRYVSARYETSWNNTFTIYWDGVGEIYLSSASSASSITVDDGIAISCINGGDQSAWRSFSNPLGPYEGTCNVTSVFSAGWNTVYSYIFDLYGTYIGTESAIYLINVR